MIAVLSAQTAFAYTPQYGMDYDSGGNAYYYLLPGDFPATYYGSGYNSSYSSGSYAYPSATLAQTLVASCAPMQASARVGETIAWYSSTGGGNGSYQYYWSGSDGLVGSMSTLSRAYATAGEKYATLSVSSGGQSVTVGCTRSASILSIITPPPIVVTTVAPVVSAKPAVATAKAPTKTASGLEAFCAASRESTITITTGKETTVISCDKLAIATTSFDKNGLLATAFGAGIGLGSPFFLALLALVAIGIAIYLAMRKKEQEEKTHA